MRRGLRLSWTSQSMHVRMTCSVWATDQGQSYPFCLLRVSSVNSSNQAGIVKSFTLLSSWEGSLPPCGGNVAFSARDLGQAAWRASDRHIRHDLSPYLFSKDLPRTLELEGDLARCVFIHESDLLGWKLNFRVTIYYRLGVSIML